MRKHYKENYPSVFAYIYLPCFFSATNVFAAGGDLFTVADVLFEMCICTSQAFRRYWQD